VGARFCAQCGAKLVGDANFCVECGTPIAGRAARRGTQPPVSRYAPLLIVAAVVLVAGAAVYLGIVNPKVPPSVPSRQGPRPQAGAAPGAMPEGHPPIAIPDDVKQTIRDMAKAAEAQPDNLEAWKRLAEVQYRAGQIEPAYLDQAALAWQHVLEREPKNPDALRELGNIAFDREQPEKAIGYYDQYLQLKPDDKDVFTDRATMLLAVGKTDEAIAAYQRMIRQDPSFFQAQFNLGLAYHRAGRSADAVAALQKARDMAKDEQTRKQVEQVLARVQSAPTAAAAPAGLAAADAAASSADTLRAGVEQAFRSHPILASKLDRFEWEGDTSVRVLLHEFPMAQMPEFARLQMADRIKNQIKKQKASHHVSDTVRVQLVDTATNEVMETLTE
jgi:tetratricopeptide (TPR) repeat protein